MTSYLYEASETVIARDGKPFCSDQKRVVTVNKMKDHFVITRTHHPDRNIQTLYEEFKLAKSKIAWLVDNKERCEKYDINVGIIIEKLMA